MNFEKLQPKIPEHVLFRELGGEGVLLNLQTEQYFGLDEVGTRIWMLLVDAPTIQVAFDMVLQEYEVDAAQLMSDMRVLLQQLVEGGLLELHPSA
jgi:hypothetical protein